jgi:hypothetical protein
MSECREYFDSLLSLLENNLPEGKYLESANLLHNIHNSIPNNIVNNDYLWDIIPDDKRVLRCNGNGCSNQVIIKKSMIRDIYDDYDEDYNEDYLQHRLCYGEQNHEIFNTLNIYYGKVGNSYIIDVPDLVSSSREYARLTKYDLNNILCDNFSGENIFNYCSKTCITSKLQKLIEKKNSNIVKIPHLSVAEIDDYIEKIKECFSKDESDDETEDESDDETEDESEDKTDNETKNENTSNSMETDCDRISDNESNIVSISDEDELFNGETETETETETESDTETETETEREKDKCIRLLNEYKKTIYEDKESEKYCLYLHICNTLGSLMSVGYQINYFTEENNKNENMSTIIDYEKTIEQHSCNDLITKLFVKYKRYISFEQIKYVLNVNIKNEMEYYQLRVNDKIICCTIKAVLFLFGYTNVEKPDYDDECMNKDIADHDSKVIKI